jgi:polysaccharide transporter, PST family
VIDAPRRREEAFFDPPEEGLKDRVVRGAIVTYVAHAIRLSFQIVSVIVMSRLLVPADFGLIAMVTPIYGLALLFQDLGLTQATIQRGRITHAQITSLFWINVAVSLGLALLLILLAPVAGWFYGDQRAANLTRAFAAMVVISATAAQHVALINRVMRFRYLAVLDTVAFLLGFLGALFVAIMLRTYWALFALPAIASSVTTIGAWIGTGFVPSLPRREQGVQDLLRLGGGIAGFNVFTFLARNLDNVLIGHAWGDAALGLYDRAYKLLLFPLQQVHTPLARVMLPALARLQNDADRYRIVYLRALGQLLLVTQPGIIFTIATADTLVPTLLGKRWSGAVPIFLWLGLAALQQPISVTTNWLFISQGRSQAYFYWGAFNAVTSTAAFFAGLPWGPIGVAAAYSITQLCPRMPVMWWMATRSGPVHLRDLYKIIAPYAVASAASYGAIFALREAATLDTIPGLAACLCVSYMAALLVLMLTPFGRTTIRDGTTLVYSALRRA